MPFVAGHFGEWLQGRLGPDGPVALVTLPCPVRACRNQAALICHLLLCVCVLCRILVVSSLLDTDLASPI